MPTGKNTRPPFIPYGRQCIGDDDVEAVATALRGDYLTTGPAVDAFEKALSERVQADHAVVCSSGTAALHLSALALGIAPGDVAIVPSLTFAATANAVRYAGGEVIFSDVDPDSGLMRSEDLEAALARADTRKVRAVLPVHYAGQCVDLPAIAAIAGEHRIDVVEDASHAIGTVYADGLSEWPVGSCEHSSAAIFSFHPVKTVAMGEGGAITTRDGELARRLRRFRNHGIERDPAEFVTEGAAREPWYYELVELGYNYRASDIQCALGKSQLSKLDGFVRRRRELADRYDSLISSLSNVVRPVARTRASRPAWHLYPVLIDFDGLGISRAGVMNRLRENGIGTQVHYIPLHIQPYYRARYGEQSLPGAERFYDRELSLPLFPQLGEDDQDRVIEALAEALGQ